MKSLKRLNASRLYLNNKNGELYYSAEESKTPVIFSAITGKPGERHEFLFIKDENRVDREFTLISENYVYWM